MGENPSQVKGLVFNESEAKFYELEVDLSDIPKEKKLVLSGEKWMYTVLSCRDKIKEFSELRVAQEIREKISNYDVIAGPIADDRMNEAIRRFEQNGLTDVALKHCLEYVQYGNQIVAKTAEVCSHIKILCERELTRQERNDSSLYAEKMRNQGYDIVDQMALRYNREGRFCGEIIQAERDREQDKRRGFGYGD